MSTKACIVIPIFDHGEPLATTLGPLLTHGLPIILVDDGSGADTRRRLDKLCLQYGPRVSLLRSKKTAAKVRR